MKNFAAFIFGAIFALGLMISGMSNPEKVLNFLDILGDWDASLAFVMAGAILIAFIPFQKVVRNPQAKTCFNEKIQLPDKQNIDKKLLVGSALFGIGWGIAGICPAPALTLIGLGHFQSLYFIIAMLIGMRLYARIARGQ
ncbi:DUF6691 family protein [Acinetobacter populi]|jgi:uncharacterized membrane protein YedE/YeeE|uniref:YeeE/YedE family protein n=1 Tax=Acinetobacter populi TaxID=1582270 RepID=A0A1Z9YY60_9GAMM|nr:DUF6691 family protein [Acinetobacter populi]MCH4247132.1 YeeE/YedE family protein [Acinetobacter populi]OUY07102.1 YeeE/YedE family protein [Acinetobacter populi]